MGHDFLGSFKMKKKSMFSTSWIPIFIKCLLSNKGRQSHLKLAEWWFREVSFLFEEIGRGLEVGAQ